MKATIKLIEATQRKIDAKHERDLRTNHLKERAMLRLRLGMHKTIFGNLILAKNIDIIKNGSLQTFKE